MTINLQSIAILCGHPISHNMETVLVNLGRMLADDFELHLLVGQSDVPDRLRANFSVEMVSIKGFDPAGLRYAYNVCSQFLNRTRPDVMMNIGLPHTLGFVLARFGKKHRIPVVIRMTGDTFHETHLAKGPINRLKKWLLHEKLGTSAFSNATVIAAVGVNLKKSLIARGFSGDKIKVVPQPFDAERFSPVTKEKKRQLKERLGLDVSRKTVLFIGRISWLKGADRLVEIAGQVHRQSDAYQFCLVGSGELEAVIRSKFTSDEVLLPGAVSNEEIADYYKAADLFVFPSRTEGLPNTILESVSVGLPIMASPVGEIPYYVSNTSEKTDDYVDYILSGKWQPEPIPEWFSWEHQKDMYKGLFNQIIQKIRD